jgi:hypothetical protein
LYNLISFPHYTCGGLLCDILNNTWSEVASHGGIRSINHSIGKIGDSNSVFVDIEQKDIDLIVSRARNKNIPYDSWIGTHCWLGKVNFDSFAVVINITTETTKSKLYRWLRAYHHYFFQTLEGSQLSELEKIDKTRENAKQYLIPFAKIEGKNVINLEFSDVVECTAKFTHTIQSETVKHIKRWQQINSFLYNKELWTSFPVKRFFEAEYEYVSQADYMYC